MLLSAPDEEVLAAAEELAEELRNAQRESTQFEFDSLLRRCNDAITEEIGVDYGSVCDVDDCC
ncbi:halo-CC-star protein HcsS [Halohasta litorea]|uniref:Halo-CC-star protein HcsS n=1 Tax=Halohasta litorea TaxID=869891 RepID=A0ABD6D2U8_9EURY|nr:halo-CC-star protein HcsS [Halohasta litorea]MEA1930897.1 halo-CC-star protein HcsS [Euryarchaeota archaeon]